MTLSNFAGQDSFSLGGSTFKKTESGGAEIYERGDVLSNIELKTAYRHFNVQDFAGQSFPCELRNVQLTGTSGVFQIEFGYYNESWHVPQSQAVLRNDHDLITKTPLGAGFGFRCSYDLGEDTLVIHGVDRTLTASSVNDIWEADMGYSSSGERYPMAEYYAIKIDSSGLLTIYLRQQIRYDSAVPSQTRSSPSVSYYMGHGSTQRTYAIVTEYAESFIAENSVPSSPSTNKQIYDITATRRSHIADGEAPSHLLSSNWWGMKIIDFNDGLGDIRDVRLEVHLSGENRTNNAKIDGLFRRYNENLISVGTADSKGMLAQNGSSALSWTTDGGQYKNWPSSSYEVELPAFDPEKKAVLYYLNNVVSLWFHDSSSPNHTLMRMSGSIEILTPNITD